MQPPALGTTTAGSLDIPQEIVDLIIDNIVDLPLDDYTTLCACSLISKAFNASACRHMFNSIKLIYDLNAERRLKRLRKVLEAKPRLVSHIRSLTITIGSFATPFREYQPLRKYLPSLYMQYMHQKSKLVDLVTSSGKSVVWLLQTLCNARLTTLTIEGRNKIYSEWHKFLPKFAKLLLSIAQSNSYLEALKLSNIAGLPTSILVRKQGDTLRRLSLEDCELHRSGPFFLFDAVGSVTPHASFDLQNLQSLVIDRSDFLGFNHGTPETTGDPGRPSILHLPKLEFLSVKLKHKQDAIIFWQLMTSNVPLLRRLRIPFYYDFAEESAIPSAPATVEYYNLASIKDLSVFNVKKAMSHADTEAIIRTVVNILNYPILPAKTIESISIEVSYANNLTSLDRFIGLMLKFIADTDLVDNVVCNRSRFSRLQKVDVHIFIYGRIELPCYNLQLCHVLPRLLSSGLAAVNLKMSFIEYST